MEDLKSLKAGDKVWVIGHPPHTRNPVTEFHQGTVTKVGRKYITVKRDDDSWPGELEHDRESGLNKDLMYSHHRTWRLYIDRESYERAQERDQVERLFGNRFSGYSRLPLDKEVTTEDIRAAAKLLRINLEAKE